ncbi:MAG: ABC-2 family transporter protein [Spirochaetales bacterium]|nr:ABC-2 family transporter protein [Spirochaetales bacterium]
MIRKYSTIFSFSLKNQMVYVPAFMFRNVFFILVLFVFSNLWRVVYGARDTIAGLTLTQALWYLAFTETVELGKVRIFDEIQTEVKEGTLAYTLNRPYSYLLFMYAKGLGSSVPQMLSLALIGSLFSFVFAGPLPYFNPAAAAVVLMGGVGCTLAWMLLIGVLSFWFEEVTPFYWLLQKLIFIIGGMFIPIDFFPPWLESLARYSPFAFSAYWPAIVSVDYSSMRFLTAAAGQGFYILLLLSISALLYRRGIRQLSVQGG